MRLLQALRPESQSCLTLTPRSGAQALLSGLEDLKGILFISVPSVVNTDQWLAAGTEQKAVLTAVAFTACQAVCPLTKQ